MFIPKIRDIGYFALLTSLHLGSNLQPVIEANANLKTVYPSVNRNLTLQLGYKYNHWMLVKAIMYSLLSMIGVWYSRHLQSGKSEVSMEKKGILKTTTTAAEQVKNNWIKKQNSALKNGTLPRNIFLLFALPWILTFVASGLINYIRFYMVIQHFCISNWRAIQLYGELQGLFWHRSTSVTLIPYWSQIIGGGVSLEKASHLSGNCISIETHLLD
uniref:IP08601p n=1 Tax=Drosophila melanogaster TaxID=7227 RepID=Q9VT96_DROME|nr:uncharacterized protein Dmel_CG32061 [Drosophila melanogaster]AAF50156.2 uncharacterized protein Dmel_CG32061 [Drosophila melanogaster]AAY55466.1 IP08601p [Drosophila melanogaster]AOQ09446.1 CG32061-RA [synthetic construct]|eukprot:NP_729611.1 uncharacterized protein Dmel_CG32061 [Drosophila melanogaster]